LDGFVQIRRGLLDHALEGKLSPFDFGLYVWLIMRANYATGIYEGCALTIACQFGDPSLKPHLQKALRRLRDKKYINYRNGDGSRGAYEILINKFSVTVGELSGTRLDAWKHGDLVKPDYEHWNGHGRVETLSRNGRGTVVAPNKELRSKEVKENPALSHEFSTEEKSNTCERCNGTGLRGSLTTPGKRVICECRERTVTA
jgi:hypothetical protein